MIFVALSLGSLGFTLVCLAQRRLSWWPSRALGFGYLAVATLALHACAPRTDTAATVVSVPGGSISWTPTATVAEIASGTATITPWLAHWNVPEAVRPIRVTVQRHDELLLRVAYRYVGTGQVFLELEPDGSMGGLSWEVPLAAQGVLDPPSWTWGPWGPLFKGQAAWAVAVTEKP